MSINESFREPFGEKDGEPITGQGRAGYSGGTYTYSGYTRPDKNPAGSGRGSYQYSPNGGWQAASPEPYRWDYSSLNESFPNPKRKRRRGGTVALAALVLVLAATLLIALGYGAVEIFAPEERAPVVKGPQPYAEYSYPDQAASEASSEIPLPRDVTIHIAAKPPAAAQEDPAIGEAMTIPQVARAVRPSVVGVVNYSGTVFSPADAQGSGIVISDNGYIATNAHVVAGAESLTVVFEDETEVDAVVVGTDTRTDLAVIRVDRDDLIPATFGDSGELEVGERVIAIGNPGGTDLAGSVTQGIVSAINRVMETPYLSNNYIQTDAAINPGNSGGALCNGYGQVVGINSAKIVATGYEGISFAIPITEAMPILEDLIQNGRVTSRVILGITGEPINDQIAREKEVPVGVQITSVSSQELKEKDVRRMDIITYVGEERILDMVDLFNVLQSHEAGDEVTLTLYRPFEAREFEVSVTLLSDLNE
ncbi:MAG: trypsin-like peptidase domain-containing protein [Oscillospiraceae bacterium]|jgi:serine protease Do|nr:trypsin-like peptidase domain-containing protein [Oscillospiraceae bacterium]